jgi:hypothetical protein
MKHPVRVAFSLTAMAAIAGLTGGCGRSGSPSPKTLKQPSTNQIAAFKPLATGVVLVAPAQPKAPGAACYCLSSSGVEYMPLKAEYRPGGLSYVKKNNPFEWIAKLPSSALGRELTLTITYIGPHGPAPVIVYTNMVRAPSTPVIRGFLSAAQAKQAHITDGSFSMAYTLNAHTVAGGNFQFSLPPGSTGGGTY